MDTEFHYYITGIVAHAAGFSERDARIIAYASEFVDENDRSIEVTAVNGRYRFSNFISQTMNILKPKAQLMRIYPIFHFVPGEPDAETARRRDGRMHRLNTTPDSEYANTLFDEAFEALEDTRLYRIGIATHMMADTWAHQNFVGWYDSHNHIGLDVKPNIGHADAEHHPDWPGHHWVDTRLVDGEVNNSQRFLAAAEKIFRRYCSHIAADGGPDNSADWPALRKQLLAAMGRPFSGSLCFYRERRLQAYRELAPWLDAEFDERQWFDEAITTRNDWLDGDGNLSLFREEYYWREDRDHEKTDWYRFQVAVKDHEHRALEVLSPVFAKMGVTLGQS